MRRADGQVVQLPELLYRLVEQIDGRAGYDELAERFSEASGRGIDADGVQLLVDKKLRPLGVLAAESGAEPQLQKADPLLALRFKTGLVPPRVVRAITTLFKPLFLPPVVLAAIAGFLALDAWLLFDHGIAQSLRRTIYQPELLLMLLGGVVLATAFHETGHATACRYGGAKPGVMGAGIYIIWPVFYTDVTDAYRLGKAGRLRTDLGGIYFNAIFALVVGGLYFATRFEPLLLLVLLQNFAMIQQLLPFVRLDGYYVISDLTGVPDMLSRIGPTLRSLIPGREPDEKVKELKPWVRRAVATYVLLLVPVLAGIFTLMVIQAPRVVATAWDSLTLLWDELQAADGLLAGAGTALQIVILSVPAVGLVLTGGRVGFLALRGSWSWSADSVPRRAAVASVTLLAAGLAVFTLWPNGDYKPIQPGERGTLQSGLASFAEVPSGRPGLTQERESALGGAPTERERMTEESESDAEPARPAAETETETGETEEAVPYEEGSAEESQPPVEEAPPPAEEETPESYEEPPPEGYVAPEEETAPVEPAPAPEEEVTP